MGQLGEAPAGFSVASGITQLSSQSPQTRSKASVGIESASKPSAESELALRTIAMPVFANSHGDIFGGWLLSQMDLAGSAVAVRRANGRVVTVAVTAMSFQRPVFVGDEVSCYANILKVGRTSITVKVEAFARRGRSGEQIKVTEGVFTYVAVDSESKPRPV
jgi:acyl-CoA thioesterase YciA